jgi:FkbM family methyltransferase
MSGESPSPVYDQLCAELAAIKNELADVRVRYDMLHKRQVLPLDGGMLAIRHEIGWIIVAREDFASVVHLSDGFSGHEAGTLKVMLQFIRPGDTVLDLGAHIGLHTIPLAHAVGPKGKVIAVEPLPRTAECLRRTLICNALYNRCELVVAAAGDQEATSHFFLGGNSMLGSLYPTVDEQCMVDVREIRIDDLVGSTRRVDFVKMDVEGAELKALEGMRELIARNPDIGLIAEFGATHLERVGIEPADWFEAFASAGLPAAFVIDEASGTVRAVDLTGVLDMYSANILFVRDVERLLAVGLASDNGADS